MREIDLEKWPRRSHFEHFLGYDDPFLELCVRVEVTDLYRAAKARGESVFGTMLWAVVGAANEVPQMRQRVRTGDEDGEVAVVEFDAVHPSFTVMAAEGLFNFRTAEWSPDRRTFLERVAREADEARGETELYVDSDHRDDLIFVTSLPWLDFTSVSHPFMGDPEDCTPRLSWGRIVETAEGGREVAVNVSAHHALVDGVHVARFFDRLDAKIGEQG